MFLLLSQHENAVDEKKNAERAAQQRGVHGCGNESGSGGGDDAGRNGVPESLAIQKIILLWKRRLMPAVGRK